MMRKRFALALFAVLLVFNAFAQDREFYLWNTTALKMKLSEKAALKLSVKTHYLASDDRRDLTYMDLNFSRKMNDWLKLGVAFRGAELVSPTNKMMEYRPQAYVNFSLSKGKIKYSTTNRLEYRFFNEQDGHARYYHNIFVNFPKLFGFVPKTYIGEELFIKLNDDGLHLARLYGGAHVYQNQWLSLDLYYVWQKLMRQKWATADVAGLNVTFSI